MSLGGMQLLPQYKQALDPRFLAWYRTHFTFRRMGYHHWSAGPRTLNFVDYHIVITEAPLLVVQVQVHHNAPVMEDLHEHTFQRNGNSFAACVASMQDATTNNLGKQVATPAQMRRLADVVADVCVNNRIPVANLMSHAEAADNMDGAQGLDFYGPRNGCERWDWFTWISPMTLTMRACTIPCPAGWLYWPDWFRGEVIKRIQAISRHQWTER